MERIIIIAAFATATACGFWWYGEPGATKGDRFLAAISIVASCVGIGVELAVAQL
jgi:hypothetical protein